MKLKRENIGEHYNRTQIIYDLFWMNKKNLGMHFGFWEKGTKSLHEAILNENKIVAESLEINKSDVVLDAGCGVGGTALWIAETYGANVIGITLSEKQIELARKYTLKRKLGHLVKFYVKDFRYTDFPNGAFTKILAIESVSHNDKKGDFIKESFRLLKPNGRLVVADGFVKEKINSEEEALLERWCNGWAMPKLSTAKDFQEKLEEVGFVNINIIDKTKEIEPSSKRVYLVVGKFLHYIFDIMRLLKLHSSHGGTEAAYLQYIAFKDGIAKYYLFSAQKP